MVSKRIILSVFVILSVYLTFIGCQSQTTDIEYVEGLSEVSTYPSDSSTDIPVNSDIVVTFSEDVYVDWSIIPNWKDVENDFDFQTPYLFTDNTIVLMVAKSTDDGEIQAYPVFFQITENGKNVTFTPVPEMPYDFNFSESIPGAFFRTIAHHIALQEDIEINFQTELPPPQSIVSTFPETGATGVPVDTSFAIVFAEPVPTTLISEGGFDLPVPNGTLPVDILDVSDTSITLKPQSNLPYNFDFEYTFPAGDPITRSKAGATIEDAYTWQFSTEKAYPPVVTVTVPEANTVEVPVDTEFKITFNEPIDTSGLTSGTNTYKLNDVDVKFDVSFTDTSITIKPEMNLQYDTFYEITIPASSVISAKGVQMAEDYDLNFTTIVTFPPTVISAVPANGAEDVPIYTSFTMEFSEKIDTSMLTEGINKYEFNGEEVAVYLSFTDTSITIDPDLDLEYGQSYSVKIPAKSIRSVTGKYMVEDYIWQFTTAYGPAKTPPVVNFTTPEDGNTDVSVKTPIVVSFDQAIDMSGLTIDVFKISEDFSVTVTHTETSVKLIPATDLKYETVYSFEVPKEAVIAASSGIQMLSDYTFSFTTEKAPEDAPPTVLSTTPSNNEKNIRVDSSIKITFNRPIDTSDISDGTILVSGDVTGTVSSTAYSITFVPSSNLEYEKKYTVTLPKEAIKSTNSVPMESDYVFEFTTVPEDAVSAPTVILTYPLKNAVNVAVSSAITVTFDKQIDTSSITTTTFTGNNGLTGSISASGKTATFTPMSNLSESTTYTMTLSTGVKDIYGNSLASDYVWSFTTTSDTYTAGSDVYVDMCASNDANYVYGLNKSKSIDVINVQTREVEETLPIGTIYWGVLQLAYGEPTAMGFDSTGNKIYITTKSVGALIVFDVSTLTFETQCVSYRAVVALSIDGIDIVVAPGLNRVFVVSTTTALFGTTHQLTILNYGTNENIESESLDMKPVSMALDSSSQSLFIKSEEDSRTYMTKYSVSGDVITEVSSVNFSLNTKNFALSPDGSTIAVSTGSKIVAYDSNFSKKGEWSPGSSILYKIFSPDGSRLYASSSDNRLISLDTMDFSADPLSSENFPNGGSYSVLVFNTDGSTLSGFSYNTGSDSEYRVYFYDE